MNIKNNNRPKLNQHEVQYLIHLSNFSNFHYHILSVFYFLHVTRYIGSFLCMHCLSIQHIKRVQCQVMKATLNLDWNSPEDKPPALLLPGPSITGRLDSRFYTSHWPVGLKSDGTMGQTMGKLEVDTPRATVPSLSTCNGHTTGHWPVALFKRRDRRRDMFNCPSLCGSSSHF